MLNKDIQYLQHIEEHKSIHRNALYVNQRSVVCGHFPWSSLCHHPLLPLNNCDGALLTEGAIDFIAGQVLGTHLYPFCNNGCLKHVRVPVICVPGCAGCKDGHYGWSSKWAQGRSGPANIQWCRRQSPREGVTFF